MIKFDATNTKVWGFNTEIVLSEDDVKELPEVREHVFSFIDGKPYFERVYNNPFRWILKDVPTTEKDEYMKYVYLRTIIGDVNLNQLKVWEQARDIVRSYVGQPREINHFNELVQEDDFIDYRMEDSSVATLRISHIETSPLRIQFNIGIQRYSPN